jgi:hypothetical protein
VSLFLARTLGLIRREEGLGHFARCRCLLACVLACAVPTACTSTAAHTKFAPRLEGIDTELLLHCEAILALIDGPSVGSEPRLLIVCGQAGRWKLALASADGRIQFEQPLQPEWGRPQVAAQVASGSEAEFLIGFPEGASHGKCTGLVASFMPSSGTIELLRHGTGLGDRYGIQLALAGDIDGDGVQEVLVGADQGGTIGVARSGYAELLDGELREPIRRYNILESAGFGSCLAALGDFDSDGIPEHLVGGRRQAFRLYSGVSGEPVEATLRFDASVTGLHVLRDMNNDGVVDLILERLDGVQLVSGATGKQIQVFHPPAEVLNRSSRFPGSVARNAGDFDGDGTDDWVTGDFCHARLLPLGSDHSWNELAGRVTVYSGKTGKAILIIEGVERNEQLGRILQAAGDVDGDGLDDVYVGSGRDLFLLRGRTR